MEKEDIKQVLLQIFELQLEYQLRAIRQLQGKPDSEPDLVPRRGKRRQSLVDLCLKILTEEGKPLHVNELAQLLQQRFARLTDRDTLSSALAKKARRGILLRQSAPATFTLIDSKEDHHETARSADAGTLARPRPGGDSGNSPTEKKRMAPTP
jgi:hypothetical protein